MSQKGPKKEHEPIQLDWEAVKGITGNQDMAVAKKYVTELGGTIFFQEGASVETIKEQLNASIAIIESIKPRDSVEAQLLIQMTGAHNVAMECLRRANISSQTFQGRNMALAHANKFLRLYMDQLNALNKHRGKGQQKVTVEYVKVEAGGQAIVGNVSAPGKKDDTKEPSSAALTHQPAQPIDMRMPAQKEKAKVQSKKRK